MGKHSKIRTLCSPAAPDTKSFDELVTIMKDKGGKPKPTEIAARFAFGERKQQATESVSDFHLALKEMAQDCIFGATLETRLRDQLVSGLSNRSTQEELLSKKDLDYNTALEFALSRECALKEVATFTSTASSVHRISGNDRKMISKPKCRCCGKNITK